MKCASPIIAAYTGALHDRMSDDERCELIPFIPRLIGARSLPDVERRRAFLAVDRAIRTFAPEAIQLLDDLLVIGHGCGN